MENLSREKFFGHDDGHVYDTGADDTLMENELPPKKPIQGEGEKAEPIKRNLGGYEIVPSTKWAENVEDSDSLWNPGIDSIYQGEPYAPWGTHENFVIPKSETTDETPTEKPDEA